MKQVVLSKLQKKKRKKSCSENQEDSVRELSDSLNLK